jgi:uncharacterized protein
VARILLLLIIAFAIYLLFRGFFRVQTKVRDVPAARGPKGEDMVTCTRCGVNLPRSDARLEDGKLVCQNNPQCLPQSR